MPKKPLTKTKHNPETYWQPSSVKRFVAEVIANSEYKIFTYHLHIPIIIPAKLTSVGTTIGYKNCPRTVPPLSNGYEKSRTSHNHSLLHSEHTIIFEGGRGRTDDTGGGRKERNKAGLLLNDFTARQKFSLPKKVFLCFENPESVASIALHLLPRNVKESLHLPSHFTATQVLTTHHI